MNQSTFSIRLEEDVKKEMEQICDSLGVTMSTAFNIFARSFIRERGFPFDVRMNEKECNDSWDGFTEARRIFSKKFDKEPSLDEINEEITASRKARGY